MGGVLLGIFMVGNPLWTKGFYADVRMDKKDATVVAVLQ